jgi:hypothetical protein
MLTLPLSPSARRHQLTPKRAAPSLPAVRAREGRHARSHSPRCRARIRSRSLAARRVLGVRDRHGIAGTRDRPSLTCGAAPLAACTADDIVRGLAVVSAQLQGLGAFFLVVAILVVMISVVNVVLTFAGDR